MMKRICKMLFRKRVNREERRRDQVRSIVKGFSRGSVNLILGCYETEKEVELEKQSVLNYKYL
jgi:hypothetical protein